MVDNRTSKAPSLNTQKEGDERVFCKNLYTLRKRKGLSQEVLATQLGVVRQTISKWEKGLSLPDAEMLIRLADLLDTSVEELLGADIKIPETNSCEEVQNQIANKLAIENEFLAEKRRTIKRVWKIIGIIAGAILLLTMLEIVFFTIV